MVLSKKDEEAALTEAEVINIAEDSIKVLLNELQKVKIEKDIAVGSLLLNLKEQEEEFNKYSEPFDQKMVILQKKIMDLVPSVAHSVKTESGSVSFRKGYIRASYDTDALDQFLELHPRIKHVIVQFRSETPVKSSIGKPEVY